VLLALGVASGAFGAHALRNRVDAYLIGVWEKAVLYHFLHALALLLVPMLVRLQLCSPQGGHKACLAFFIGLLLFSGSLYLLVLTGTRGLGAVTPIGGIAFIAGWALLALDLSRVPHN
ncbi:MAG TPA: DUF423 domain-containing protein, partial [Bryobacteraceae bacterium]|nr:DUF423 domain-containing protein [Bryobacteraceae bacterium]